MLNIHDLTNPGLIDTLYSDYFVADSTPESAISSHWKEHGAMMKAQIDADGNLSKFAAYGMGDFGRISLFHNLLCKACNISYLGAFPYKQDLLYLMREARLVASSTGTYVGYESFRQLCALAVIRNFFRVEQTAVFDAVVIGDGFGFFSAILKKIYPHSRITLIDIGKTLFFQAVSLEKAYPGSVHLSVDSFSNASIPFDFLYVPAEKIDALRGIPYRLGVNIASMQEMNYESINKYFDFLRRQCSKNNLFYCCNRISKTLIGGETVEFFKFPWSGGDKHIVDEKCGFCKYAVSPNFPFIRPLAGAVWHRLTNLQLYG